MKSKLVQTIKIPADSIKKEDVVKEFSLLDTSLPIFSAIQELFDFEIPENRILNLNTEITRAHALHAGLRFNNWKIALAWVLRQQTKTGRLKDLPFASKQYKLFKRLGACLDAKLELCFKLFDTLDEVNQEDITLPFKTAVELWFHTMQEEIEADILRWESKSRSQTALLMRDELAALKILENPYCSKNMPCSETLFNVAITICQQRPGDNNEMKRSRRLFRERAYKPYCKAYWDWIVYIEKNPDFSESWVDKDRLVASNQRSKGKPAIRQIYPAPGRGITLRKSAQKA